MNHLGGSIRNRLCNSVRPIRIRLCNSGRPKRTGPCNLGGAIGNSCFAKCQGRIFMNLSNHKAVRRRAQTRAPVRMHSVRAYVMHFHTVIPQNQYLKNYVNKLAQNFDSFDYIFNMQCLCCIKLPIYYAMLCHAMSCYVMHVLCHVPCATQRHLAPETKTLRPQEIPRSSPASPRKTPSFPPLLLRLTHYLEDSEQKDDSMND